MAKLVARVRNRLGTAGSFTNLPEAALKYSLYIVFLFLFIFCLGLFLRSSIGFLRLLSMRLGVRGGLRFFCRLV